MSKVQISASIRQPLRDEVTEIQVKEGRSSFSEMIEVLLDEAVKARKDRESK